MGKIVDSHFEKWRDEFVTEDSEYTTASERVVARHAINVTRDRYWPIIEELVGALEIYADSSKWKKIWNDLDNPTDLDLFEITGKYSIADFEVKATETLVSMRARLKG